MAKATISELSNSLERRLAELSGADDREIEHVLRTMTDDDRQQLSDVGLVFIYASGAFTVNPSIKIAIRLLAAYLDQKKQIRTLSREIDRLKNPGRISSRTPDEDLAAIAGNAPQHGGSSRQPTKKVTVPNTAM